MNRKVWLLLSMAGLIVLVTAVSAVAYLRWATAQRIGLRPAAPDAPPAPTFQPPVGQPAAGKAPQSDHAAPAAIGRQPSAAQSGKPQQYQANRLPIDGTSDPPAYGLPLDIHIDAPEVPPEIAEPAAQIP